MRVSLEHSSEMAKVFNLRDREEPSLRQHRIQSGSRMTLGEDKAVSVWVVRISRINGHNLIVQQYHALSC